MSTDSEGFQCEAVAQFVCQNYDPCLAALQKILKEDKRKGDPRVHHNVSVAEFFKGGCVEVGRLQQELKSLCKLDVKPKKPTQPTEKKSKESTFLCLEYDGHEVSLYNEAVLLYHSYLFPEAIRILQPMFDNRDSMSLLLAIRVCFLLLACTFAVQHRALLSEEDVNGVFAFLDSQKEFMTRHDEALLKDPAAGNACRSPLLQQHQLLIAQRHITKKEMVPGLQILHSVAHHNGSSVMPPLSSLSPTTPTALLPTLYFNNLGVVHMILNKPHMASLYFTKAVENFERNKGQCPYSNAPDATLNSAVTGLGTSKIGSAMCHVLYNLGMCLMIREKYELAFRAFVVATPLLHTFPCLWLKLAQCCIKAHEITVRKEKEEAQYNVATGTNSLIHSHTMANGTTFVLPVRGATTVTTFHLASAPPPDLSSIPTLHPMSLTFADKCLRNAHYLLLKQGRLLLANCGAAARVASTKADASAASAAVSTEANDGSSPRDTVDDIARVTSNPSTEDLLEALCLDPDCGPLVQAVYVNMAYVALAMNNPSVALYEAKQLLALPNCSRENKIVILSYIAEALCWLNKPSEALQILHGVNLQELLADKMVEMNRRNAESLFVNLSIVHILQSKYQRAQECVKQFIARSSSNHSILLQIYLDLVQGNREHAYDLLKKHDQSFTAPL